MRTWFITGASRGFGELIAKKALEAGDAVVAAARKTEGVAERFGNHPNLLPVQLDVTNEAQAHQAVAEAVKRFGRIDILVNNAGINIPKMAFDVTESDWDRVLDINLKGVLHGIYAVYDHMLRQRGGHIVNIASIYGNYGVAGAAVYSATKACVPQP